MQEEVENRTVTLITITTKMTGRALKGALQKYLAYQKPKASRHLKALGALVKSKESKAKKERNISLTNIHKGIFFCNSL